MSISGPEASVGRRLADLTFQAAKGRFGEPVRFLAGVELELQITDNEKDPPDPHFLDSARESLEFDLQYLEQAVETAEDRATLDLWREQLPEFNAQDLLNALVYVSLSRPTLRPGARPSADDYDSVIAHTRANGGEAALDFRFGRKPCPFSFYDHPKVSEFPIMPVEPPRIDEKTRRLTRFIGDEASYYGCILKDLDISIGVQPNISAYRKAETKNGVKWMPVIGRDPSLRSTTADAMAGLTMAIEDGTWFSSTLGRVDHNLIGEESLERHPFTVGVARSNALRINHQWVENRTVILQGKEDIRHSLLWMMAGITYGLEKGADAIGALPGRSKPELRPTVITTRTEDFDERVDAPLRQMLQSCSIKNDRLVPDPQYVHGAGQAFTEAMIGKRLNHRATAMFINLFIGGLHIGEQGELKVEEAAVIAPRLLTPSDREELAESARVKVDEVDSLFISAAILAHSAGFRARIQDTLHSTANYPALTADEWTERLRGSEIFRRVHGKATGKHAVELGRILKQNPHTRRHRAAGRIRSD